MTTLERSSRKIYSGNAGYIAQKKFNGAYIVIYLASEAGIDTGTKYAVSCETHNCVVGATSLPKARAIMKSPDFCELCVSTEQTEAEVAPERVEEKPAKRVKIVARYAFKASPVVAYRVRSSRSASEYCVTLYEGRATGCDCSAHNTCYHMTGCQEIEAKRQEQQPVPQQVAPVEADTADRLLEFFARGLETVDNSHLGVSVRGMCEVLGIMPSALLRGLAALEFQGHTVRIEGGDCFFAPRSLTSTSIESQRDGCTWFMK